MLEVRIHVLLVVAIWVGAAASLFLWILDALCTTGSMLQASGGQTMTSKPFYPPTKNLMIYLEMRLFFLVGLPVSLGHEVTLTSYFDSRTKSASQWNPGAKKFAHPCFK